MKPDTDLDILKKSDKKDKYYCYMVRCSDNSLYTGYTTDLSKRLSSHNSGRGAKYTRSKGPCTLAYYEEFDSKNEAMKQEYYIKHKLKKSDKEALILKLSRPKKIKINKINKLLF